MSSAAAPSTAAPGWRLAGPSVVMMAAAATAAAGGLLLWWSSPAARYLDHGPASAAAGEPHVDHTGAVAMMAIFAVAWLLMAAATMLPTAVPLLMAFDRLVGARADRRSLALAVVGGFLGVWALSGILLSAVDLGIHGAVEGGVIGDHASLILATTLVAAGAYQLSPAAGR